MDSLSISQIHYDSNICFENSPWIQYVFPCFFPRFHQCFVKPLWVDYLFPESTINPLSISRIYYEITIWFYLKVFHIFKNVFSDLWSRFSRTFFTCSMGSPERHHVITGLSLSWNFRSRTFRWCLTHKADVIEDVTKQVFFGSAYANDHLRPKVWFDHDRKDMENLLVHKLKKMLIFDQKILEVSNMNQRKFIDYES